MSFRDLATVGAASDSYPHHKPAARSLRATLLASLFLFAAAWPCAGQAAAPQKEHKWLEKLVGEWTYELEAPGQNVTGTERFRSIRGLWFIGEGDWDAPGGPVRTITLGYDPQKQSYVGMWVSSMRTYMWVYTGELDASERMLTLHTEGPDMTAEGKTAQYKDVIEFKSDDERTFTHHVQGADGQWQQLMQMTYRRTN